MYEDTPKQSRMGLLWGIFVHLERRERSGSDVRRYPKAVPYGRGRAERIDRLIVGPGISAHDAVEFFYKYRYTCFPKAFAVCVGNS